MIIVSDLNGNSEMVSMFNSFEMFEEVNGEFKLSFTSFFHADNPGHALLKEESLITVEGYDFRVKNITSGNGYKRVEALTEFNDLIGYRQDEIYGGTRTFNEFATFTLTGTGWTFTNLDVVGNALIPNFGQDNVILLLQAMCKAFECEYKIMPGKHIIFAQEIGPDNDAQYRYGYNVKALSRNVDTTDMRMSIKGYGAEGLEVTYTSPYASQFPHIGQAEPIYDERYSVVENFTEYLRRSLNDVPKVAIELDTVELSDKELGERVWLIYEPMGIEFQTRVLARTSTFRDGQLVTKSVLLGNAQPKTLSDLLSSQNVEIDQNKKETRSRFEQTNDRITLEVERIDDSIATIELRADSIELSVSSLDSRMGSAESSISIQAGQIASKVSQTDYNGNTIASLINQTSTTIDIQADKINLVGAVTVLSDISGNLGTITAGSIMLSTDVEVGRYLRVGRGFDTMSKGITFKGTAASIDVNGDNMSINAQAINLNGIVSASNLNATTLQGYYPWDFASSGHSHFYPMQIRPGYEHQIGTTFYLTSTRLVLRTPSGTELQFASV